MFWNSFEVYFIDGKFLLRTLYHSRLEPTKSITEGWNWLKGWYSPKVIIMNVWVYIEISSMLHFYGIKLIFVKATDCKAKNEFSEATAALFIDYSRSDYCNHLCSAK